MAAAIILFLLRMVQGLCLGGSYGGAITYVAEHVPEDRRGYYTGWLQTSPTLGIVLSLIVIIAVRGYFRPVQLEPGALLAGCAGVLAFGAALLCPPEGLRSPIRRGRQSSSRSFNRVRPGPLALRLATELSRLPTARSDRPRWIRWPT